MHVCHPSYKHTQLWDMYMSTSVFFYSVTIPQFLLWHSMANKLFNNNYQICLDWIVLLFSFSDTCKRNLFSAEVLHSQPCLASLFIPRSIDCKHSLQQTPRPGWLWPHSASHSALQPSHHTADWMLHAYSSFHSTTGRLVIFCCSHWWWLSGRFGALCPESRRFASHSSRHVGTLGKSFTLSCR